MPLAWTRTTVSFGSLAAAMHAGAARRTMSAAAARRQGRVIQPFQLK
jgi:hypothetical protein